MRKFFYLRDNGQPLIQYQIGNARHTFLWIDNWHPLGPLHKHFGERIVHNIGRALDAKISDIIVVNAWKWPRQRNRAIQQVMALTPISLIPDSNK